MKLIFWLVIAPIAIYVIGTTFIQMIKDEKEYNKTKH